MISGYEVLEAVAEMPFLHRDYLARAGPWVGQCV